MAEGARDWQRSIDATHDLNLKRRLRKMSEDEKKLNDLKWRLVFKQLNELEKRIAAIEKQLATKPKEA